MDPLRVTAGCRRPNMDIRLIGCPLTAVAVSYPAPVISLPVDGQTSSFSRNRGLWN